MAKKALIPAGDDSFGVDNCLYRNKHYKTACKLHPIFKA
jgi:hypothetical protein